MAMKPLIVAARYKWLLLVPFLVILPIALALMLLGNTHKYTSLSKVWVEQSTLVPTLPTADNQFQTPAQNRASDLTELLATDSFTLDVAHRAGFPVDTDAQKGAALAAVRAGTSVFAEGQHLVDIQHSAPTPAEAKSITDALVAGFTEEVKASTTADLEQAIAFYTQQLNDEQSQLNDAQSKLEAYHATSSVDPQLTTLTSNVQNAQLAVSDTRNKLRDANALTNSPGTQTIVDVRDKPTVPTAPDPRKKTSMLLFPVAGLLLAVSLSAGLYGFLLRTDNSIRVAEDLQALPGLLLLGTVPDVSKMKKRGWPRHFYRLAVTALGSTLQR
jgi:capsular polysaccharide biosynthesis protein